MARRIHRRLDLAQVSVLALAVLTMALAGCAKAVFRNTTPVNAPVAAGSPQAAKQPGERIELTAIEIPFHSSRGDIEGVIHARSAEGDLKEGGGLLKHVTMEARERGVLVASAQAGEARMRMGSSAVSFAGGVVFELKKDRASVRAQKIVWNWQTGQYTGSGGVEVRTDSAVGKGAKVVGNTRTGKLSIQD
jgi:hypothetical protein